MYHSIMIPLDGYPTAERAIPVAARLARNSGARLHFAQVVDLFSFPPYVKGPPDSSWWNGGAIRLAEDYLSNLAVHAISEFGIDVSTEVLEQPIAASLLKHAEQIQADLIVTTTHGKSGWQRMWLGSISDELARSSSCPTLFLRAAEVVPAERVNDRFEQILVPLDGSILSEAALPAVVSLARAENAQITLLTVARLRAVPMSALAAAGDTRAAVMFDLRAAEQDARDYLEMIAEGLEADGFATRREVLTGADSPAVEILDYARGHNIDVITMSTHGEGGVRRLLLGSVADKVLRASPKPVLLIRPREEFPR